MKYLLIPLLFMLLACACVGNNKALNPNITYFDSGFSLCQDTIIVDVKGEMTHALKYQDKLYLLFKQRILKYGGYGKRWLYVFANGEVEQIVECPPKMRAIYLDFFVLNDRIMLKPYMDKQCYYLDTQTYTWSEVYTPPDLIFEDERFHVYSLDFGEWGGKTWFKDKETNFEYVLESTTPLVNKISSTYYLTNSLKVLKIDDPLQLAKCEDENVLYENIRTSSGYHFPYGDPIGFDIIYDNTSFDYFDVSCRPHIVSSFVWQEELLHIFETDSLTYIAEIKNDSIKPIQAIAQNLRFFNCHYSYRCKNTNGNNELLKFHGEGEQQFGIMDIIDNNVHIHHFINKAKLKPESIGSQKADSIFTTRLNYILSNPDNLRLKNIDKVEQVWGSFDITPNHKVGIGDSWNPRKYVLDTCKSYLIQEDTLISNSIIYYATKSCDLIRAILCDWEETDIIWYEDEKSVSKAFDIKLDSLTNYITKTIGAPSGIKSEKNYVEIVWTTSNGLRIDLEKMKDKNRIRLIIYHSET